jgi:hypothetical protein
LLAHEVLYNQRMSGDLFAYGELSNGYGDGFITRRAQQTELAFQHFREQQERKERWQRILSTLFFLHKPRTEV